MTKTIALPILALLLGCSARSPLPLPEGNMPMTEREYLETQLLLLKKQELPTVQAKPE